ncbi:MAG: hypothetical protein SV765_03765 [Pseudomonadota bacterium]|nr:hypothetical protein [Pseudomonadota bacterium]
MKSQDCYSLLALISSIFELIGVILMANVYINIGGPVREKAFRFAGGLISSLKRGKCARKLVVSARITEREDRLTTLQGLAFIAVGFILQLLSNLLQLIGG